MSGSFLHGGSTAAFREHAAKLDFRHSAAYLVRGERGKSGRVEVLIGAGKAASRDMANGTSRCRRASAGSG